jgi:hypothetical protein
MVRTKQPNPQWTLTRAVTALYGSKTNRMTYLSCRPNWGETIETLREFVELDQLGENEWGKEAKILLEEMERKQQEEEAEEKVMFESESWCTNPFSDNVASIGACAFLTPVIFGIAFNWNTLF